MHPARVPPRHPGARHRVGHRRGVRPGDRPDAAAGARPRSRARRRGTRRPGEDEQPAPAALRLQVGRSLDAEVGRAPGGGRGPGLGVAAQRAARPHLGQELPHLLRVHRRGRSEGRLRPDLASLAPPAPAAQRSLRVAGDQRHGLAGMGRPLPLRGTAPGRRRAFPAHAEGPHLRADRRHRGRPDHLAPRGAGRCPQLGLPLLLAARLHAHPGGAARGRLSGGGRGLARLAAAGGRGRPGGPTDHVRPVGRTPAVGVRDPVAVRIRGLRARPGRQQRRRAVAARRVRRGHRLAVARAAFGPARRGRTCGACSAP